MELKVVFTYRTIYIKWVILNLFARWRVSVDQVNVFLLFSAIGFGTKSPMGTNCDFTGITFFTYTNNPLLSAPTHSPHVQFN